MTYVLKRNSFCERTIKVVAVVTGGYALGSSRVIPSRLVSTVGESPEGRGPSEGPPSALIVSRCSDTRVSGL